MTDYYCIIKRLDSKFDELTDSTSPCRRVRYFAKFGVSTVCSPKNSPLSAIYSLSKACYTTKEKMNAKLSQGLNNYDLLFFSHWELFTLWQDLFLTASRNHELCYHRITNTTVCDNTGFGNGRKQECCLAWIAVLHNFVPFKLNFTKIPISGGALLFRALSFHRRSSLVPSALMDPSFAGPAIGARKWRGYISRIERSLSFGDIQVQITQQPRNLNGSSKHSFRECEF